MKVIIIDDEPSALEALCSCLSHYQDVTIVGTASNGSIGISMIQTEEPDLLFLDVELPDMSGLEFLEQLNHTAKRSCKVVIYTAHSSYMLPAFRGKAFDFLLKPLDKAELDKVMQRYDAEENDIHNTQLADTAVGKDNERLLFYTTAVDFRVVEIRDVGLFQYNHNQRAWEVVVAGNHEHIRLKRAANNESLVSIDKRFVQVSQRYIININYLMEVNGGMCRFYPPFDTIDYVKVGRLYRKKLIERFSSL